MLQETLIELALFGVQKLQNSGEAREHGNFQAIQRFEFQGAFRLDLENCKKNY